MTAKSFRLAVAQSPAELDGPRARLDWLAACMPELASVSADMVLLPELFLTGYNVGDEITQRAEPSDGPMAREIAALAARLGVAVHYGYAERDGEALYNAAQCFGPDGKRLGGHRKLLLPPGFEADHFACGTGCELFTFKGVRFGTLVCYDAEFPETARHVAALGAEVLLVPTALGAQWGWVANTMIPARAYENGVFLGYANHAGSEHGMEFLGASFIAAPDGEELARAQAAPGILIANLELRRVAKAQMRLPYLVDRNRLLLEADTSPR
ncbi:MAG: carbon-nitrogen hydrolase family protein [Notoacmeibacter sp.]|nr:carbon-nitrogen hydrolase family protein [Notoacmeibacter sp.]